MNKQQRTVLDDLGEKCNDDINDLLAEYALASVKITLTFTNSHATDALRVAAAEFMDKIYNRILEEQNVRR